MDLTQIAEKLEACFAAKQRTLVFWYDAEGEFQTDIAQLRLANAKIVVLDGHNQFAVKLLLEHEDKESNYLVYAPFAEPDVHENHLADTALYAKHFSADRATLILQDLHLDALLLPVLQAHSKFFASKERLSRFYDLSFSAQATRESLVLGMMCVLGRVKSLSLAELLRSLLASGDLLTNATLQEFAKYDLLTAFWQFAGQEFGYREEMPNLFKLARTLFLTNAARQMQGNFPQSWQSFVTEKKGNVVAFLDSMADSESYRAGYRDLSQQIETEMQVKDDLQHAELTALAFCDTFPCVDEILLDWVAERLLAEDLTAKIGGEEIPSLCQRRAKTFFGQEKAQAYAMMHDAYAIIAHAHYVSPISFAACVQKYVQEDYRMDAHYRHFYLHYDKIEHTELFEQLRDFIENIYTNSYLDEQLQRWNDLLTAAPPVVPPMGGQSVGRVPQEVVSPPKSPPVGGTQRGAVQPRTQRAFYRTYLYGKKEKTVVIISDALRYEVGQELWQKLADEPKISANLHYMLSTLPSYTRLGMLALLPHKKLELSAQGEELLDGKYIVDLQGRQEALQQAEPKSVCLRYDELMQMKREEQRQVFAGRQIIYIYHDQIDNAGEHTPEQTFAACETAIAEIKRLILQLSTAVSISHFLVTADHGFIYKRDAVDESGKIAGVSDKNYLLKRRYIIGKKPVEAVGVRYLPLSTTLDNDDGRFVSFPLSYNVFKAQGSGGLNYVHGGSSPQELIVPVIEVQTARKHLETHPAEIRLLTMLTKITGLTLKLEFVQTEPVSDTVRAANYSLYFADSAGNKVTGVESIVADRREEETAKRIFAVPFAFKNQRYEAGEQYALIIRNRDTGKEIFCQAVQIEIAFQ